MNQTQQKEIITARRNLAFYQQCYEKLGYTVHSVDRSGRNYIVTLERETPQTPESKRLELSMEKKLRFLELTDRKRSGFLSLFCNLSVHVALFILQGVILYAMHLEGAHPKTMLQVGMLLIMALLVFGLVLKLKELSGWKQTSQVVEHHLYDPPTAEEAEEPDKILSILLTRNHGLISDLIYWCTGRQFTHASLGLGAQTDTFYSFGLHGFTTEHPAHRKVHGKHRESLCYQFRVSEAEYQQVAQTIAVYLTGEANTQYNLLGAILSALHIYFPLKSSRSYFCSEFVSDQLRQLPSFQLKMKAAMYLPSYLAKVLIQQENLWDVKVNEI